VGIFFAPIDSLRTLVRSYISLRHRREQMHVRKIGIATLVAMVIVAVAHLVSPPPAEGSIHEIIAALCRAGGEEVVPPGQNHLDKDSFLAALQATGFITSIDFSDSEKVVINFDPTIPASKYVSAGFDLTITDGFGPGVDLVLSPLVVPNPKFPAHANCNNLR
jgi:hypothetical protein